MTQTTTIPSQNFWFQAATVSSHFVGSLFEPFTDTTAQNFYRNQYEQIQQKGIGEYSWEIIKGVGRYAYEKPKHASTLALGAALGWQDPETLNPAFHIALGVVATVKNGQSLNALAETFEGSPSLKTGIKVVILCIGISSIPTTEALEWMNVADAKSHYSGGPCSENPWTHLLGPAANCVREGGTLQECRAHITDQTDNDLYVFTRHHSNTSPKLDPVSIVKLHEDQTCFYTNLGKTSLVTRTCFKDIAEISDRTVEEVKDFHLKTFQDGLEPGQSTVHIGMKLQDGSSACALFHDREATYDLGDKPICVLTTLGKEEPVSQVCFDPQNPESVTLKEGPEEISLDHGGDGPVSLVFTNPKAIGLNPNPDRPVADSTCALDQPSSEGFSIWDALSWWWHQKTPCQDGQEV